MEWKLISSAPFDRDLELAVVRRIHGDLMLRYGVHPPAKTAAAGKDERMYAVIVDRSPRGRPKPMISLGASH
jgi:hypothetical protein